MGLWVNPDVPAAVQAGLRGAALAVMAPAEAHERLPEIGFESGQLLNSEEMHRGLRPDHARIGAILTAIGFKPE